ncbi:MAG: hypothetical protein KatS3mg027_2697 [Bacteroidia bacterium]|nr:MAG: hypothetical protein KatS3mg027_2697 [Bacteroidia bacterium]
MNKKIIISLFISVLIFFTYLFFLKNTSAQVCLPMQGYLVWPGNWRSGNVPMASSSQYFLTNSPIYVSGSNVGIGYVSPVYTLQVNGDISGTRLCIGSDCRNSWPGGGIAGNGLAGQITFWTGPINVSGDNNLFWDNTNKRLGIGITTPQTSLHVIGNVTANNFLGTINASNVSSGQFGANTGGGNYYFMGNVGIGTTTPAYKLDVNGQIRTTSGIVFPDGTIQVTAATTLSPRFQIFTSNGIWIRPPGVNMVWVTICGGGGGGGGGSFLVYDGGRHFASGGGGGGANCLIRYPVSVSENVSVTVGAGGVGGATGYSGSDGGSSAFGSLIVAGGGGGGLAGYSGGNGGDGGKGGGGTGGGFFNYSSFVECMHGDSGNSAGGAPGGSGGSSRIYYGDTLYCLAGGGGGAGGYGGAGGAGGSIGGLSLNGGHGSGYGSGGGGGAGTGSGGNGAPGIVIVEWWQ